ncbi:YdeI/OmpD-associated family protein [Cohnella cholangitidis]|uniref:DUF1905 domain-containing protein n=1 Tax=Cohnella cholangitidis TaxID=2598458 RepID=A0A7G5BW91_9BACL|nr:YdeI/OmpD-associated family protein [Cohnella cholangitidis]QMV41225.1 DUF1905 domain-containing protein [Cohnella cholangitidis]
MQRFNAELIRPEGTGTWTFLKVPFNVEEAYGSKSHVKVKGTLNGNDYRGTLMPDGTGNHFMVVNKVLRDAVGATTGSVVHVTMESDMEVRAVGVPDDLRAELEEHPVANAFFNDLAYSYQKEYVTWIEAAKKLETRRTRIAKSISLLAEGKKLK